MKTLLVACLVALLPLTPSSAPGGAGHGAAQQLRGVASPTAFAAASPLPSTKLWTTVKSKFGGSQKKNASAKTEPTASQNDARADEDHHHLALKPTAEPVVQKSQVADSQSTNLKPAVVQHDSKAADTTTTATTTGGGGGGGPHTNAAEQQHQEQPSVAPAPAAPAKSGGPGLWEQAAAAGIGGMFAGVAGSGTGALIGALTGGSKDDAAAGGEKGGDVAAGVHNNNVVPYIPTPVRTARSSAAIAAADAVPAETELETEAEAQVEEEQNVPTEEAVEPEATEAKKDTKEDIKVTKSEKNEKAEKNEKVDKIEKKQ